MRFQLLAATAVLCVATAACAHADTIQVYNLYGTLTNGGTVNGTITYNFSNPFTSSASFTTTLNGVQNSYTPGLTSIGNYSVGGTVQTSDAAFNFGNNNLLQIVTAGTFGGTLCTLDAPCAGGDTSVLLLHADNSYNLFQSGQLAAATPEPSSFALLATGLLATVGVLRKRLS